ncbi:hypothetical protein [Clostridium disporicum]|uniref:hypothetical protein n=1 Tax=Clostridium disporicum TaxID=84024 RepID=UPI0034A329F7
MSYSVDKNRVTAFIFIEGEFYSHEYHTECVTEFLKKKGVIKTEKELYQMLKNKKKEHIARRWMEQIEENCVFGEVAHIDNKLAIVVFDNLTEYGLEKMKTQALITFGIDNLIFARFTGNPNDRFQFITL